MMLLLSPPDDLPASACQFGIALLTEYAGSSLAFETVFWGVFTCLIICSTLLWIWDCPHNKRRLAMIALCLQVLATHFGEDSAHLMDVWNLNPLYAVWDLQSIISGANTAPTVLLTITILLSDAIVLYRACILWAGNRTVQVISATMYLCLIAASSVAIYDARSLGGTTFVPENTVVLPTEQQTMRSGVAPPCRSILYAGGVFATCLSLGLNLWATFIIGYKAWKHKRVIRKYLSTGSTRTRSEKILILLVDSGFLYCILWTVVTVSEFQAAGNVRISVYLPSGALIHLIGIYPTILVAAISIERLKGPGEIHTAYIRGSQPRVCSADSVVHKEARKSEDVEAQRSEV